MTGLLFFFLAYVTIMKTHGSPKHMKRNIYIENIPLEKALEQFMNTLEQSGYFIPPTEKVSVWDSPGRVTASPVTARRSSPHYAASAMDGIAVQAADTFCASETNPVRLPADAFLEVDTGDYVPAPYNAVIMIEDVVDRDGQAEIIKAAVPWQHIRSVGEDLVSEDMVITSLQSIGPYELAAFITAGVTEIEVTRKPIVGIIPTGTEMVDEPQPDMEPGLIVESNSYMLGSMCREWGAEYIRHPIVADDPARLLEAVRDMIPRCDLLVVCSGSSAGREDFTSGIIEQTGRVLIHGLAIKPGKPAILGIIDDKPVIGVPGYPISAQLVFTLFAKPVLYRRQGLLPPVQPSLQCQAARKIPSPMGVDEFIYVNLARLNQKTIAYPLSRGAGIISSLVKADGCITIPRGQEGIEAGQSCSAVLLRPASEIDNTLVCIGSHDLSLDILMDQLRLDFNGRMVSTNVGSMAGLMALARGETHMAGLHLLDPVDGSYNVNYLKRYLTRQPWQLIHVARRQQGLIVKKGNPLGINSLLDLTQSDIRFINRQKGAGTRILLDYLLNLEHIDSNRINGYTREEYTHLAVAAAVKNDACDCGLGIMASARVMGLDFIPLSEERYDLCVLTDLIPANWLELLKNVIMSSQFADRLRQYGGYNLEETGMITVNNY